MAIVAKLLNSHGDVVEDAIAGALRAKGMMGAAGQRAAETIGESLLRGRQGSPYTGQRALNELRRPGKPDSSHGYRRKIAINKLSDVFRIVNAFDGRGVGQRCRTEVELLSRFKELTYEAILGQRKLVGFRQRKVVMIGVEEDGSIHVG